MDIHSDTATNHMYASNAVGIIIPVNVLNRGIPQPNVSYVGVHIQPTIKGANTIITSSWAIIRTYLAICK
jgi:hypothetical protein